MKQDSYMDQAAKFAETTKDQIVKQATQVYDTVQKTVTNEENQQQAAGAAESTVNTIGEQARGMYETAEKTVTDEENQQMVKDKWNEMADSLKAMIGGQSKEEEKEEKTTFEAVSNNVQNFLTDAKTRLEETDFQDIQTEANTLLDQVKKTLTGDSTNEESQQKTAGVVESTVNTIGEQVRGMYETAEKTVTDEENQQIVKDKWNEMANSLKAMIGGQPKEEEKEEKTTFEAVSNNVQNFLTDAKTRLEETDFQDIQTEANKLLDQVKKTLTGNSSKD